MDERDKAPGREYIALLQQQYAHPASEIREMNRNEFLEYQKAQLIWPPPDMVVAQELQPQAIANQNQAEPMMVLPDGIDIAFKDDDLVVAKKIAKAGAPERRKVVKEALPKRDHNGDCIHEWKVKWEDAFRECACGQKQWKLACWTGYQWRHSVTNDNHTVTRQDISKQKTEGGMNTLWTSIPHRIRSADIIPEDILNEFITVIGAGAIGSFTMLPMMKMGFHNVTVYDPDVVSVENLGTQLHGEPYLRYGDATGPHPKILSLSETLFRLRPERQAKHGGGAAVFRDFRKERYEKQALNGVVIMAVDNMAARKLIWEGAKAAKGKVPWVIDARMGGEYAMMYTMDPMNPKDVAAYEKTLYTDEQGVKEPCTARSTVYTAMMIGGLICKTLKDVLSERPYARVVHWDIKNDHQKIYRGGLPELVEKAAKG